MIFLADATLGWHVFFCCLLLFLFFFNVLWLILSGFSVQCISTELRAIYGELNDCAYTTKMQTQQTFIRSYLTIESQNILGSVWNIYWMIQQDWQCFLRNENKHLLHLFLTYDTFYYNFFLPWHKSIEGNWDGK